MKLKVRIPSFLGYALLSSLIMACANGVQNTASQSSGSTTGSITKRSIPVAVVWKGANATMARAASARSLDPSVNAVVISVFDAANGASEGSGNLGSLGSGNGFGGTISVNETGLVVFEALASDSGGSVLDVARSNYTVTGSNDGVTLTAGPAALEGGSIQGQVLTLSTVVNTIAGSTGYGSTDNGTGTFASFYNPFGITTDGTNIYVADSMNNEIRKVSFTAPYAVTTIAGSTGSGSADNSVGTSASFNGPAGITTDGTNLYVADSGNNEIRKVLLSPPYAVTTIAGSTTPGSADNGTGTSATFASPYGITTDGTNLYIADNANYEIRKVSLTPPYAVTTIAGSSTHSGSADNATGTSASFNWPSGITTDGTYLYITDSGNNEIRKASLSSPYAVTTIAGSTGSGSSDNSTGTSASFNYPFGITTDGMNLYVTDAFNNEIRKVSLTAPYAVITIAGSTGSGSADGTGTSAKFNQPIGITTDGTNLYATDFSNNEIRKIQ